MRPGRHWPSTTSMITARAPWRGAIRTLIATSACATRMRTFPTRTIGTTLKRLAR
jgi:hypothetical protein